MAAGDLTLNIGHLTGLGGLNPDANDLTPLARPGTVSFVVDALGFGIFKYIRAIAALTKGQLCQLTGTTTTPIQTITNTGAFTTKAIAAGLTVNDHQGKIAYVLDDAGAAGALPEGEFTIVASNSATDVNFEPDMPLSVALANNDTVTLIATYQVEVGTAAVFGMHCPGVAIGNAGISAGQYGWVKAYGIVSAVNVGTPTTALGDNMIAATTGAVDVGTTTHTGSDLWVGSNLAVTTDDQATPRSLIRLTVFTANTANAT